MPKMIDLGRMEREDVEPTKPRKRRKHYPSVWLDAGITLPLKAADVGKDFTITGKIHVTGIEERVDERDGRKKTFNFELRSMAIHNSRARLKDALKSAGS